MDTKKHSKTAWLWENMKGYRAIYALAVIGTVVYNFMQLTVPYITQNIIDLFLTGENATANLVNKRDLFLVNYCNGRFYVYPYPDCISGVYGCGTRIPESVIPCQNASV